MFHFFERGLIVEDVTTSGEVVVCGDVTPCSDEKRLVVVVEQHDLSALMAIAMFQPL